ncbi:thiosulfate:glutathione sulfurtransferase-like [Antedon mediterranea]|uniref:thiosulfate:glutathione sulfurtransferase-like n=1 Tax=Antedon mediterranea TaxID=105859 RepID=UPI003AF7AB12
MTGKSVFTFTFKQISNKYKLGASCLPRSNHVFCVRNAKPRFSSTLSSLLLRGPAVERCLDRELVEPIQSLNFSKLYATQSNDSSVVPFEELEKIIDEKKNQIVDVREPAELEETGRIGQAMNIPVGEVGDAFKMSAEEFQSKYGHKKPNVKGTNVIFYCLAGKRSKKALEAAHALGYVEAKHFPGGWMEWASNKGLPV